MSPRGKTYMHIPGEGTRRQVGTRVAEITASRRRHFLSLAPALPYPTLPPSNHPAYPYLPPPPFSSQHPPPPPPPPRGGPGVAFHPFKATSTSFLVSRVGQASVVEPTRGWRCTWNAILRRRETTNLMCPPG